MKIYIYIYIITVDFLKKKYYFAFFFVNKLLHLNVLRNSDFVY